MGAAALGPRAVAAEAPAPPQRVTLGRTGLEISNIGFGSGSLGNKPQLVRYAFDRGINHFDSAESYPMIKAGLAEKAIGQGLAGLRDQVVLTSKTIAKADERRGVFMRRLNQSLRRLRTDRIDIYYNHAVNEVARVDNPEWLEFIERAKRQGKIRFSGMSGHGGRLIECLDHALDRDLVDVILVAHNFGADPAFYERFTKAFDLIANQVGLPRVLAKAKQKKVGVVAMKTLLGAKLNDMRPYEWEGSTFAQAAFRWTLSQPDVDALIVSMKTPAMIDEYLVASGKPKLRSRDARLLDSYLSRNSESSCRPGCDACEAACPNGVAVSDVLRARMYAADYGELERGRLEYEKRGGALACADCQSQSCLRACPYGLPVAALTRDADRLLRS